ncbi:MAG: hypothetical protein WKF83_17080 [Nocardioidaceae bacterium]
MPSSHRPDPPQIEYIVPTWTWEERTVVGARARLGGGFGDALPDDRSEAGRRRSAGLSSRPWYSSGADELLGVVVRQQPWLTLPIDRRTGLLVSAEAGQAADLAAERILAAGVASGRGSSRLRPAERLLAQNGIGVGAQGRGAVEKHPGRGRPAHRAPRSARGCRRGPGKRGRGVTQATT